MHDFRIFIEPLLNSLKDSRISGSKPCDADMRKRPHEPKPRSGVTASRGVFHSANPWAARISIRLFICGVVYWGTFLNSRMLTF
jgi:hypothetical protein